MRTPKECPSSVSFRYARVGFDQSATLELPPDLVTAHPLRRSSFALGRKLAYEALVEAGCPDEGARVGRGLKGMPVWPEGYCGSISHTRLSDSDIAGVAVAARASAEVASLGVDVERVLAPERAAALSGRIVRGDEAAPPRDLAPELAASLVFSAKESLYKALFPRVRCYFGFHAAGVEEWQPASDRLTLALRDDLAPGHLAGALFPCFYSVSDGLVLTLVLSADTVSRIR